MEQSSSNITTYHRNDVLCGRGRFICDHPGNKHFISIIKELKNDYVAAPRKERYLYADLVVKQIRSMDPPGRFLKRCHVTYQWIDIGDSQALAKARQALREGAPDVAKQLQAGNIKGKGKIFATTKALVKSAEQPLARKECLPKWSKNDEAFIGPEIGEIIRGRLPVLREMSSSNDHDHPSAEFKPIPFNEPTVAVPTSRDDAKALLRILTLEPSIHDPPIIFPCGEVEENIDNVENYWREVPLQQLQQPHTTQYFQPLSRDHKPSEEVSMPSTCGNSTDSCYRESPNQYVPSRIPRQIADASCKKI